jgi:hypothetical protein
MHCTITSIHHPHGILLIYIPATSIAAPLHHTCYDLHGSQCLPIPLSAADLMLTLTPTPYTLFVFYLPVPRPCLVIRKHSAVSSAVMLHFMTSSRFPWFRAFVHALFQYAPISHYHNWRRPRSYYNYCALLSLLPLLRSFVLTYYYVRSWVLLIFVCSDIQSLWAPIQMAITWRRTRITPQSLYKHWVPSVHSKMSMELVHSLGSEHMSFLSAWVYVRVPGPKLRLYDRQVDRGPSKDSASNSIPHQNIKTFRSKSLGQDSKSIHSHPNQNGDELGKKYSFVFRLLFSETMILG